MKIETKLTKTVENLTMWVDLPTTMVKIQAKRGGICEYFALTFHFDYETLKIKMDDLTNRSTARYISRIHEYLTADELNAVMQFLKKVERMYGLIVRTGRKTDLYKQMRQEARGYLEAYKTDLTVHDAFKIGAGEVKEGEIWTLRAHGTNWGYYEGWKNERQYRIKDGKLTVHAFTRT